MPTLNPDQFFHGTSASLASGDEVKPAQTLGMDASPWRDVHDHPGEVWKREKVFSTHSEARAWGWANASASHTGHQPVVYEVAPSADVSQTAPDEHASATATVKRRIDIPPPTNGPRQGTLPGGDRWDSYEDLGRHSDPEAVKTVRSRSRQGRLF